MCLHTAPQCKPVGKNGVQQLILFSGDVEDTRDKDEGDPRGFKQDPMPTASSVPLVSSTPISTTKVECERRNDSEDLVVLYDDLLGMIAGFMTAQCQVINIGAKKSRELSLLPP